ncbi:hypothetical protein [Pedobacter sandarakinus]|uniref:hypothetical protein n=1 Tax=Pedobacter sandarakinus TaxID=353156 RepID=UPI002248652A|nr:hypothetical protein [Pedobacter sandarakinus]MCX2572939.1 hypothetical protein [Pedobacter sandarakinus]
MNENIENNDWKLDAPSLAALDRRNPYLVPDQYFEDAEAAIKSEIYLSDLKSKTSETTFSVPHGYFEDLAERIETNVKLSQVQLTDNSFAVPDGYFESLQQRIADKVSLTVPVRHAKIIPLWKRSFVKYASAACFAIIASFGAYYYQNSTPMPAMQTQSADLANDQMLYDIDESTIIEHLETQSSQSTNANSASDTEMENYILSNFSSSDLSQELNN